MNWMKIQEMIHGAPKELFADRLAKASRAARPVESKASAEIREAVLEIQRLAELAAGEGETFVEFPMGQYSGDQLRAIWAELNQLGLIRMPGMATSGIGASRFSWAHRIQN